MRKSLSLLGTLAAVVLLGVGCAGPEQKFSRGLSNMTEILRGGEMQRSMEQHAYFDGPDAGLAGGIVSGFNRTMARTGLGIYEVITFPLPSYEPVWTDYLGAKPAHPDSYQPRKLDDSTFDTDHAIGFSGGDIAPIFPGSHFRVFDN